MTNEQKCLLGHGACQLAASSKCNDLCPAYLQLHGTSGLGGRAGTTNVPRQHRLTTIHNTDVRNKQTDLYQIIDKYIHRLFTPRHLKDERLSLYLYSESPGTGKTTSASAILNTYLVKTYIRSVTEQQPLPQNIAYFLDANEWQTVYNEATRKNIPADIAEKAYARYYEMKRMAEETNFLVLDDVLVRSITDGHRGDLHSLVNHRVSESMPTVYTSNIPLTQLPELLGEERLYDRMRDMTLELHFQGASQRGMK